MSEEKNMIRQLQTENETFQHKIDVLEQGFKNAMKENTVLRVDINVLKTQLKETNKFAEAEKHASSEGLETQLHFVMQENEKLKKDLDESKLLLNELEKKIQVMGKNEKRLKELEKQVKAQNEIIKSQQEESEQVKMGTKTTSISMSNLPKSSDEKAEPDESVKKTSAKKITTKKSTKKEE